MSPELSSGQRWFRRGIKATLLVAVVVGVWLALPETVIEVRTVQTERGLVEDIVPSLQAGSVKGKRQVELRASTMGQVAKINVQKGDRIKEGQLLVELDSQGSLARLRLAQANLATGQSAIRAATVRLDATRRTLERTKKLAEQGVLASQALERTQAEYDVAAEAVQAANAGLGELQAAVNVAQTSVDDSRIKAPFDGLVVTVAVEKGESLVVGSPVLDLVDDSSVTVEASVDEADAGKLKAGMAVRVHTDAFPNRAFDGSLIWISPVVARDMRQNRRLDVEVGLDGSASLLKVGLSTDIEIIVDRRPDVVFVPTTAVMRKGEINQVYVIIGGKARLRTIKTGLSNWERTEVTEGLREGERVIVSLGEKGLKDGVRVRSPGAEGSSKVAY